MRDDASIISGLDELAPPAWRRAGFERPLAGLLLYIVALLALTGPYLWLTTLVIPARVQPFPRVDGLLGTVSEVALLAWALADFGIMSAVVRAVAGLRASRPEAVLPHLRLLVRWQLAVALGLCALGLVVAPQLSGTRYAPLARAIQLRALAAPLFLAALIPTICEALQRYDRQLLLELVDKRLLGVLVPVPIVLAFRAADPASEVRALDGAIAGQALAALLVGLLGLVLLRGLGLPLGALLLGSMPTRADRRALLRFGAGIMSGKAIFFLAGLAELALVVERLADYPRWLGIKAILLGRLLSPLWLLWPFCESAVPCLTEAFVHDLRALARSYVLRFLSYGHLFTATLFALVLGAAPPLLVARLAPPWHAAAELIPLAGALGLLLPLTWIGDAIQRARGQSTLNAGFLLVEQLLRIALLVVLLPRLGLAGLLLASLIAQLVKTIAVLLHTRLHALGLTLPARELFLAPLAAGLTIALGARAIMRIALSVEGDLVPAAAFVLLALVAFPVAFFVAGLAGGFEPAALMELSEAADMVPFRWASARFLDGLLGAARAGARLGPARTDGALTLEARRERDLLRARQIQANETN